jgi:bifunctional non-homologous end joining protein LigD
MKALSRKNTEGKNSSTSVRSVRSGKAEKFNDFFKPMLATLHDKPFDNNQWIFEVKWDGYRAIAETGKNIRLYSRNGLSFMQLYHPVVEALKKIKIPAILDGEIVVLNEQDKPDFQALQQFGDRRGLTIQYYVFDCVSLKGQSLTQLPLLERKEIARSIIPADPILKFSEHFTGNGQLIFDQAVSMNLEGIIAKRSDSKYFPGKRTTEWLKIKNHNTQEAIIVGYTEPRGSRQYFGALLLAIRTDEGLQYIGHTGTGFNQLTLKNVFAELQPLKRSTSPFSKKIPVNGKVTWVEPKLVCNIKFTEITQDGILRHPVFQGLRIDKSARQTNHLEIARSHRVK